MSTKKPSLLKILSETSGIISGHSRHFLALSILFILPNSIAAIIYSFLSQPLSPPNSQLPIIIIFLLSTFLFSFCTVSSITYSTFHGFYGKPVELVASLKSILVSFFPLFATLLILETIMALITFGFVILMLVSYNALALLGLEMDYGDSYFLVFTLVIASLMIGLLIYLQVEWYLVNAVVVLESKWGFAPLKRSSQLVKGMRGLIFLVMMLLAVPSGLLSVWFFNVAANARGINQGSMAWAWIVLQVVVYVAITVVLALYGLAANTVVFAHCKELHEELAFDEPSLVYVQLPSDAV